MHSQFLSHVDDGADDDRGLRVGLEGAQEVHIDLEHVKDVVLDVVQRGVAAAEVIHPDFIACRTEACDLPLQEFFISALRSLRDLDVEHGARDIVAQADILDCLHHVHETEVRAREIDRNAQEFPPRHLAAHLIDRLTDALDDVEIELRREMRVLKNGNEHPR